MNALKTKLFLQAICRIVQFELIWSRWPFNKLCDTVLRWPVHPHSIPLTADGTSHVVDLVFAFHPRKTQCLERSIVATCVLRDCGYPAVLVFGAMQLPSRSHAWVEVDGRVINDRPSVRTKYAVLARISYETDRSKEQENQASEHQFTDFTAPPQSGAHSSTQ